MIETNRINRDNYITFNNLQLGYGSSVLIDCPLLEIKRGTICCIIGANGVGKTTLLHSLLGTLLPLRGEIRIFGQAPGYLNKYIGYLPQKNTINIPEHMTVLKFLQNSVRPWEMGIFNEFSNYDICQQALKATGSDSLAGHTMSLLSGGQKQKVYLAQAILNTPKLLLLDEPLVNLDIQSKQDFVSSLQFLSEAYQITTIVISHDLNNLIATCDYVLHIYNHTIHLCKEHACIKKDALYNSQ